MLLNMVEAAGLMATLLVVSSTIAQALRLPGCSPFQWERLATRCRGRTSGSGSRAAWRAGSA